MKLYLEKIDKESFERLCELPENEFINGTCFNIDSSNLVAFEYFYDDSNHEYWLVNFNDLGRFYGK